MTRFLLRNEEGGRGRKAGLRQDIDGAWRRSRSFGSGIRLELLRDASKDTARTGGFQKKGKKERDWWTETREGQNRKDKEICGNGRKSAISFHGRGFR